MTQAQAQIRNNKIMRLRGIIETFSARMIPDDIQQHMTKESLELIKPLMHDLEQAIIKAKQLVKGRPYICTTCFDEFYKETHVYHEEDLDHFYCDHCGKSGTIFKVKKIRENN